ncbi:MAG TPA: AAA family ATPase [Candidatus Saccharimonadales bacterium]|nr:AAA family ATPase [Candidatus Saccharimonadales bacterium]
MNSQQYFSYNSARARKAREAHKFGHADVYAILITVSMLLIFGGITIVWLLHLPLGWVVAGFCGPFLMAAGWSRSLRDIPPSKTPQGVHDLLDADLLGLLPEDPTPKQLAEIVSQLHGGKFFGARFGLGTEFLTSLTSGATADTAKVWESAERLRLKLGADHIDSGMVTAALIATIPTVDQYLAQYRIGTEDILVGAEWYLHLEEVIAASAKKHHSGGIGRDWSFGYTPLLDRFGYNISMHVNLRSSAQHDLQSRLNVANQIVHVLSQGGRHNIALVGGLGSGKTTVVHALAKRLLEADPTVPRNMHFKQIVVLDPSTLIAQAQGRGQLEALVQNICVEALRAKNIILFLDDAQLFFEDGNGAVNISNVMMPILEGGALQLIMALDEQRWIQISQANPALIQNLNRVVVPPADERETKLAMQDQSLIYEHQQDVLYTYQSMDAAYRLSNRYMAEQVMPGKALKLLETAANYAQNKLVTTHSVEQAIEQTQGVKVGTADTDSERQTLLNLEDLIHKRMINQTRAVQVVSDALRRARAGVRNASRPIGTFLFLGPTGVGKTELAKAVAAVFFNGEDHLIRLDLNEYSGEGDVQRLIADAVHDQHSLTAQIARNPFSVVLLDEIEKAHPNVLNVLLQLLDEGILRDINNREVSFRDAVVIATSNAGADRIRQYIEAGEQLEQFEKQFTDELINANEFRPEFLNRFDEIVLFRPLKPEELLQVIDLILAGVNKNLATQRLSVLVDQDAKMLLVQSGYDPRLGARPMRRVVQRVVENIVANQMLTGQAVAGQQIHVSAQDVQTMLQRNL